MSDNQIAVKITADARQVTAGVEQAKRALQSIEPLLSKLASEFKALSGDIRQGMSVCATSTKDLVDEMKRLQKEARETDQAVDKIGGAASNGSGAAASIGGALKGLAGMAASAIDPQAIAQYVVSLGKAAEETHQFSRALGMSRGEVQQLKAVSTATGVGMDQYAAAVHGLGASYAQAAQGGKAQQAAMRSIGVEANGSHSKMDLLSAAIGKLSGMADGPEKTALAMKLLGKSGAELLPILDMGTANFAAFRAQLDAYGVVNEKAVESGLKLSGAIDGVKLVGEGLSNVFAEALGPVITTVVQECTALAQGFIQSYREGGAAADVMKVLSGVVRVAGDIIGALAEIVVEVWNVVSQAFSAIGGIISDILGKILPSQVSGGEAALNRFRNAVLIAKIQAQIGMNLIGSAIQETIEWVKVLGTTAYNALTFNWHSISADWQAGMGRISAILAKEVKRNTELLSQWAKAREDFGTGVYSEPPAKASQLETLSPPAVPSGNDGGASYKRSGPPALATAPQPSRAEGPFKLVVQPLTPADFGMDPETTALLKAQYDKLLAEMGQSDLKAAAESMERDREQKEHKRQVWTDMATGYGQAISKMLTMQTKFSNVLRDGYKRILGVFQTMVSDMIRDWIIGLLTKEAITKTSHAKQTLIDAKGAASGAYKAVVGIPVVGPILAPVAAAAAFAGVMAFSAEKGAWNVGADNAPFLLHKEEMVLPAHLARPLRSLVQGGGAANLNAPTPANDEPAQVHNHSWTIQAVDARGVRRLFMDNKSELAEAVGSAFRDGFRPR